MHRVLLIDDEPLALEELAEAFEDEGFAVQTASGYAQVRDECDPASVDILITDLKMPGMNGIDLFADFRAQGFQGKAILLSGHGAESNRVKAKEAGISLTLPKPIDLDELFDAVESLLKVKEVEGS